MAMPGAPYAAPYAATPKSASSRRSARRSWFETPPATKLEIAVEKPPLRTMNSRSKRRSIDDVETLTLTHFTKPPRIGFGKIILGRSKTRILLVQNPAEYEQEVVVERFPYKKCFNVDQTHFIVGPGEVVSLTLTWTPQESGSCREMILFHIDDVYRLQAYVFGTSEDPKPVRKGRKGMLGTRQRQPPSCIVQTKSLNSIRDSYSPRRSDETRELCSQLKPIQAIHANQENVKPAEMDDVIPQTPPPLESTAICKSDERRDQDALERRKSGFLSPTLSKMSPIPRMADNSDGCVLESYFSARDQTPILGSKGERSPLKPVSGNENKMSQSPNKRHSNSVGEGVNERENSQTDKQRGGFVKLKDKFAESKSEQREKQENMEAKGHVSPNSFLSDSIARRTAAITPEIGCIRLSTQVSRVAELATVSPSSFLEDMGNAKPNAPITGNSSIPSPSTVLNDSIPHDIMLRQLEFVRKSLHGGSFQGKSTPDPATVVKNKLAARKALPPSKKMDRVSQLAQPKRCNVFAHAQEQRVAGKREKLLKKKIQDRARFAKIADVPSPRRKTYLVTKQQAGKTSPAKSHLQTTKTRKAGSAREVTKGQSPLVREKVISTDTVNGRDSSSKVCIKPSAEDPRQIDMERAELNGITVLPDHHDDQADNLDDTMTRRRRSLWASPAVKGFKPPVMASKPDCDSTGEELHTLENLTGQATEGEGSQQHNSPAANLSPANADKLSAATSASHDVESEEKGRRTSGRRLFPDIESDNLNLSADFKPLWSGSATVTKDCPSISPHASGSGNTSKKLFPDISLEDASSGARRSSTLPTVQQNDEEEKCADRMTDFTPASNQETSGTEGKPGLRVGSATGKTLAADGHSFEFCSPQQLVTSPMNEVSRRSTLTVTKSHPSQALLEASGSTVQAVAKETLEATPEVAEENGEEVDEWQTETIVIETRNSAVVKVSICRELLTPTELPTSPKSENSRRSTHAIRNPVVLNKDGLIPRNLFQFASDPKSCISEKGREAGDTYAKKNEETAEASAKVAAVEEETKSTDISQCKRSLVTNDESSLTMGVFTERVEHHLTCQSSKIVKPTQFSAAEVALNSLACSQELSVDSLDLEDETSTSRHEADISVDCRGTKGIVGRCGEDKSKYTGLKSGSAADFKTLEMTVSTNETNHCAANSSVQATDGSMRKSVRSQHSGHMENEENTKLQAKEATVSRDEESRSGLQTDHKEGFVPEVKPVSSTESQGRVTEDFCSVAASSSGPSDDPPKEKLTQAEPVLGHTLVRETLLKKNSLSKSVLDPASSVSIISNKGRPLGQGQGQLKRSLSSEFRSKALQPSAAGKQPVALSGAETKTCTRQAKSVSEAKPSSQVLPRSRSQTSLDSGKQMERLNRKRSSPEAGLKEPHSKRVELESSRVQRKGQLLSGRRTATAKSKVERTMKPSKGVALSKLILVKKSKTALPKHPLPFAAKNMYYDERWQDKQERGFVHWLNFVLTPTDEYVLATTKTKVDASTIAFDGAANKVAPRLAPTKEILSFRAYAARRRLNHLRRASCRLFQSEAVVRVVCRLELEVEQRRLAVRTDRMIHADIGIKQKILDMLLSYNPLWLRIGLETVYGEVLPIQSNSDVIGMSRFILTRLLTSPEISAHYAHPTVPHLYNDGYADAVAQHTMKKFLVLVYFLDCAKQSRLIAHDPCLFCKDAENKSSKEMLVQFSRDYLSGEGDITKHLAYMGYVVSYVQTPLHEFDYAVSNLCTDLRDGLRLGRIIMLLSGDWSFASSLRAPAISRLQKIHNVELVFRQLIDRGFDLKTAKGAVLNPRDIVDGHREKTLAFLWKLIFHFQTVAMLNEQELQEEVDMLERTLRVKLCMQKLLSRPHITESMARRDSGGPGVSMDNPMLQLLLKWCRTVGLHYGVKVENFTVSFSDGRALCCLLHHYHPALLPLDSIHFQTSQSVQEAAEAAEDVTVDDDEAELSADWSFNPLGGGMDQSLFDKLLTNEKENFRILYEKVSELGGIPLMLKAADMSNTIPDEHVVVTYVSYMCARLLDLREETRAARIMQLAWRRFCLRRSARLRQKQIAACVVIQRAWRQYWISIVKQRQTAAAVCLQAAWRGHQGRHRAALLKKAKMDSVYHEAATKIQTFARCFLSRQRFKHQVHSTLTIQSWFRAHQARRHFIKQRQACLLIQSYYRARSKVAAARKEFLVKKQSAITIQRAYRKRGERLTEQRNRAACVLQSIWKGKRCREEFLDQGQAAVCIQAWWRTQLARTRFLTIKTATTIIQRQFRAARLGAAIRQKFLQQRWAAVTLQKHVRSSQQHRRFLQLKSSAVVVQKNFRRYKCSIRFRALRLATVIIQRFVRAHQARNRAQQNFVTIKVAAVTIQRWFRLQKQRQEVERQAAATMIQSHFRGHLARKEAQALRYALKREAAAVTIQTFCRAVLARQQLQALQLSAKQNTAAVKIQAYFRGFSARKQTQLLKLEARRELAALKIQSAYRSYCAVKVLRALQLDARRKWAAVRIQSAYRGYRAVKELKTLQLAARREAAALRIQSAYRGYRAVKELKTLQLAARREAAALRIQSAYRGYHAVKELKTLQLAARREAAAIRIQSAYRGYCAIKELRALQSEARREWAAVKIQSAFRRYHAVKKLKALQLEAARRVSAVKIQTLYRMHLARRHLKALKEAARRQRAATRIQAFVRGCHQRRQYQTLQQSVLLLQTYTRGMQARQNLALMKEALHMLAEYQQTHDNFQMVIAELHQRWNAAAIIQTVWRGWTERRQFSRVKSGFTKLQAAVRGHLQRKHYQLLLKSTIVIQRWFRAQRLGQAACFQYQLRLGAVVVIQSCWKGYVVRSCYIQARARIIKAQACCRRFLALRRFQKQMAAAVILQKRFRARIASQEAEKAYLSSRQAIIHLQAMVRGCQQRRRFLKLRRSCIVIQSGVRRWWAQRHYKTKRQAAVVLQQQWRACLRCREETQKYQCTRQAVVTIQSHVRGHLARRQVAHRHQAASVIQRNYRRHSARCNFLQTKEAVVALQRHIRAFLCGRGQQNQFANMRQACITIQSAYRGYIARRQYLRSIQSAIKIQTTWRGFQQRQQYLALHKAATVCQSRYRAKCLGQVFRIAFLMIRDAAVVIQKHSKGRAARCEYQRKRSAAVLLQAHVRGRLQRHQFSRQKTAAVCIQRWLRATHMVRTSRAEFLNTKQAVITIQRTWRAHRQGQAETRNRAAIIIQKQFRCVTAQRKYKSDVHKIVQLQAHVRGFLTRIAVKARKHAITQIQRRWRETLLTQKCRHEYLLKLGAAVVLQSAFRGHCTCVYYAIAVQRIVLLQSAFRGCLQRRRYFALRQTVLLLQHRMRSILICRRERHCFLKKRTAAISIQRAFRDWQARQMQAKIRAATCIQSYVRMQQHRKKFICMKKAVTTLQAAVKSHRARQILNKKKSAIVYIQNRVRFFLLVRQLRREVQRRQQAAVRIQQAFRKHQAQVQTRRTEAASKIQAAFRAFVQRRNFLSQKQAALILQKSVRGWRDRCRAAKMRGRVKAAVVIQTHFRAWRIRKLEQLKQAERAEYLWHYVKVVQRHIAMMRIQRWYRRCVVVRNAQKQLHYIILLQQRVRAFLQRVHYLQKKQEARELKARQERAAIIIQSAVKKWLLQQEDRQRIKRITMIQAMWRGRQLRRSLKSRKIAAARKRVHEANQKATEEKKLGNRTTSALDFLLHYKQLAYILDALMHLDVATRLSSVCCDRLVEVNAVGVIYRLILSCNRSLPHMELIKYSISILLNLAKYEKTTSAVYEVEDSVTTLVDLMSIYREKGGAIFTRTCMLLAILGSDAQRKAEMCSDKRLVDKLQSIHALVLRKHRMQVARARAAARTSLNATLPSRLLAPKAVKVRPAWVLKRDSMHEIEDPLAALSFLLNTLHIGPK